MPSLLRIVGFLVALFLILVAVTVVPDLVRPIQNVLGLEGEPLGRLVTVLVISVALGYGGLFYALARADRANQRVSRLVRALSAAQIELVRSGGPLGGILVCIPAFDEADNLPGVIAEVPSIVAGLPTHVLVIDDGSTDSTSAVAASLGVHVVRHPVNSGQGAALQTGYLVAERLGVDVVVTLDADGQHDPKQIGRLVEPIVEDRADFVVGSRRMGEGASDSRTRDAGVTVYTRLLNVLGGTDVSDVANGYRAIRASR